MPAAEPFVGGAEGCRDLSYDVDVVAADEGAGGAGAEHPRGGFVVVQERHGDAGRGEGGDGEETAAFDVRAAEVGDRGDGVGVRWRLRVG
ncbi:hypothetical protein GCM10010298_25930 [Streptomyces microflavus]|uniref:Uncharacterized protein n=1 Tax=Streptomyces microflavus TaxID=1919 RepID=A0A7J0CX19_STRMI|nr:hypothetical protein Smic_56370 [Streptomyces microflavus]GGX60222.1 hypothetical protein GCM10010298_25930 [Streptomyces microflavus]